MGLKIKLIHENGEQRVPPLVMELLVNFAEHKKICDDCIKATTPPYTGSYCPVGAAFIQELLRQPEVEYFND